MEVAASIAKAAFRLRWHHDVKRERAERVCPRDAALAVSSTPHPRPLPATRFARGGRGEVRCCLRSQLKNCLLDLLRPASLRASHSDIIQPLANAAPPAH